LANQKQKHGKTEEVEYICPSIPIKHKCWGAICGINGGVRKLRGNMKCTQTCGWKVSWTHHSEKLNARRIQN
jgi:hypothetical protein